MIKSGIFVNSINKKIFIERIMKCLEGKKKFFMLEKLKLLLMNQPLIYLEIQSINKKINDNKKIKKGE